MKYITVKEASNKWNLSEDTVRKYCKTNAIPDAFINNGVWSIPEDAVCPRVKDGAVEAVAMLDCRVKACINVLKAEE